MYRGTMPCQLSRRLILQPHLLLLVGRCRRPGSAGLFDPVSKAPREATSLLLPGRLLCPDGLRQSLLPRSADPLVWWVGKATGSASSWRRNARCSYTPRITMLSTNPTAAEMAGS